MDYDKILNKSKKFTKDQRSTFSYWFYHWRNYNLVAMKLGAWKWKYLLHDIEKPWMKLILRDYMKVRKWHKTHRKHHIFYGRTHGIDKIDWEAAVIDWECSQYSKLATPLNAREQTMKIISEGVDKYTQEEIKAIEKNVIPILDKLGL